jgi:hypothetical protein
MTEERMQRRRGLTEDLSEGPISKHSTDVKDQRNGHDRKKNNMVEQHGNGVIAFLFRIPCSCSSSRFHVLVPVPLPHSMFLFLLLFPIPCSCSSSAFHVPVPLPYSMFLSLFHFRTQCYSGCRITWMRNEFHAESSACGIDWTGKKVDAE